MIGQHIVRQRHAAHFKDAHRAFVVTYRHQLAGVAHRWGERHIQDASRKGAHGSHRPVALAQFKHLGQHCTHFALDEVDFPINGFALREALLAHHVENLRGGVQAHLVGFLGRDAGSLVRRLDDHLGRTGKRGDGTAPADDAEGHRLVFRETAHPLVENG